MRIDAFPITTLPPVAPVRNPEPPYRTKVNCLLRFAPPPAEDVIEVEFNGRRLEAIEEGTDRVVSWQFSCGTDMVEVRHRQGESIVKTGRGCWNERDAILWQGDLPVKVFFNRKKQEAKLSANNPSTPRSSAQEPQDPPSLHAPLDAQQERGNGHQALMVIQPLLVRPTPPAEATMALSEVSATTATHTNSVRLEPGLASSPVGTEDEERAAEAEEQPSQEPEVIQPESARNAEEVTDSEPCESQAEEAPAEETPRPIPSVWVFHANGLRAQEQQCLEALNALLQRLPAKTIVVDFRPTTRTRQRQLRPTPLAKEHLRAAWGAKYWDMSQAITVAVGMTGAATGQPARELSRYRARVVDSGEEGMERLVRYLGEGYTFVLLDSRVPYQESARYAVAQALLERVPALKINGEA